MGCKTNGCNSELPQIVAILASSFASISNGILFSWTSPSIPELVTNRQITISLQEASYFTVITSLAMAVSAPLVSFVSETFGRKTAVLVVAVPQILSWIFVLVSNNIWIYYISRAMAGVGDAALYGSVPVYVCEISQPKVRGVWGNSVVICIYMGIFLINAIGAYCNIMTTALICIFLPILHVVFFWFAPESPVYLISNGKKHEARRSLKILRCRDDVEEELLLLELDVKRQTSEAGTMRDLLQIDSNRKALLICVLARVAQQFVGLPAFEMYTQYMFQQAGSEISEKTSAIVFSGILFTCVTLSAYIVELVGRRPLMIFSCAGCLIILTTLTIYFCIVDYNILYIPSSMSWIPLAGMSIFIIIFSSGLGILPTLLLGELFSASIKGNAVTVMNVITAGCFLVVPKLFQEMTSNFGISAPFLFFTINCFICTILSYLYVIETKGKTLEEIQQELKGNT